MERDSEGRGEIVGGDGASQGEWVELGVDEPIWDRFFTVAPLVVIGTSDDEYGFDLAVKHMAMPLGWENFFGFVCAPDHRTYRNIEAYGAFTVSYVDLAHVVEASLTTAPRDATGDKPALEAVVVGPAREVDGVVVSHSTVQLECRLERLVDGFGPNSLVVGRIVAARVHTDRLRHADVDDQDLMDHAPILVYLAPGRVAEIRRSYSFPYHEGWSL